MQKKIEPLMTQMEQWSVLSSVLNYVKHSRFHSMNHTLDIKAVNKYKYQPNTDDKEFKELDFSTTPQKLQEEYMDIYEGIHLEIVSSNRFDENSGLSTTYLGRGDKKGQQLKTEESFPISEHGYTSGRLLDGTECQLLLDTCVSKSFMAKSFYMQCKSLHSLPKFASRTQRIQVGNGQCVRCRFLILLVESCSKLVISVTEHLVEVVDKLSTTELLSFQLLSMLSRHFRPHISACISVSFQT